MKREHHFVLWLNGSKERTAEGFPRLSGWELLLSWTSWSQTRTSGLDRSPSCAYNHSWSAGKSTPGWRCRGNLRVKKTPGHIRCRFSGVQPPNAAGEKRRPGGYSFHSPALCLQHTHTRTHQKWKRETKTDVNILGKQTTPETVSSSRRCTENVLLFESAPPLSLASWWWWWCCQLGGQPITTAVVGRSSITPMMLTFKQHTCVRRAAAKQVQCLSTRGQIRAELSLATPNYIQRI